MRSSARSAARDEAREQRGELLALLGSEAVECTLNGIATLAATLIEHGSTGLGEGDDAAPGIPRISRARHETALDALGDHATRSRLIDADRGGELVDARAIPETVERRQQSIAGHIGEGMLVSRALPPE